jgi:hypothetical protein
MIRRGLWDFCGILTTFGKFSKEFVKSRKFGVQIVEETPPNVDHKPSLGLIEQLLIRVCHARLIPHWQHGIENAGAGIEHLRYVLRPRSEI